MAVDGRLDYRSYTVSELREAAVSIDREAFPKNYASLQAELKQRGQSIHQTVVSGGIGDGPAVKVATNSTHPISVHMEWRASIPKSTGLALGGVLMTLGSYYMTQRMELRYVALGWIGMGLFGLSTLMIVRQLFRSGPLVVIDQTGVLDFRNGAGVIPWTEIVAVSIRQYRSSRFLTLRLRDEESYLSRLTPWRRLLARSSRAFGQSPCSLSFFELSPGIDEAYERIRAGIERRIGA